MTSAGEKFGKPAGGRMAAGCMREAAIRSVRETARAGAPDYQRSRDLPALIGVAPSCGEGRSPVEASTIVARLKRALRAQRAQARAGHWAYDLNRHIALRQAYLAETERLAALQSRPGRHRPASDR